MTNNGNDGDIPGRLRIWADGLEIVKSHAQALMARTAADEIERLVAERDEARREVCEVRADIGFSRPLMPHMLEFAASRGWDCFKENKQ